MQNKKRSRTLLLLLLLLAGVGIWYAFRAKKPVVPIFGRQGTTAIRDRSPRLEIWDFSAIDGDTIDVYFDGEIVFKRLAIDDSHVVYKPGRLSRGEHWIGIKAISEGMMGPASPHLSISSGDTVLEFDIDSWVDSAQGSWIINVQ